jgi:hypothetical protein
MIRHHHQQRPKTHLTDEKQARDCLRRIVIKFYLRDYLGIEFKHTIPTTFKCAASFIINNKYLFGHHIHEFAKKSFLDFPNFRWDQCISNEQIVKAFIQHCQDEILDIILYLIHLLKRDANEFNYDNSRFHHVPSILMERIRIRLIKDNNYVLDATSPEYLSASNTSTRIFKSVISSLSAPNSDTDTEVEEEEMDDDNDMLVIDE